MLLFASTIALHYFDLAHLSEFAAKAIELQNAHDVYFGIGLSKERPLDPKIRDDGESVIAIPGLWLEIDYLSPNHSATNLPQRVEVTPLLKDAFIIFPKHRTLHLQSVKKRFNFSDEEAHHSEEPNEWCE